MRLSALVAVAALALARDAAAQTQTPTPTPTPATTNFPSDENTIEDVTVHGQGWSSPRGVGDVRVHRDLLDTSPHQQTIEMLSVAPGFFVDHEDGEGIGNDVFFRGFDLEHGAGIEMRLGSIPINIPSHVQGQGYADTSFILPELVSGVRVLGGPFDPRQGDDALAGSAYFDLGARERGYHLGMTYGSFDQVRLVGILAPKEADEDTFAGFAIRHTSGFGENRAAQSATLNAQYGVDLGAWDHLRVLAVAYGARATLPGVVRQDDVDAGRIGADDSYPFFGDHQAVSSARIVVGVDVDHLTRRGTRIDFEPWFMWTDFRARQNFTGNTLGAGLGDLHETTNTETALGLTARSHPMPLRLGKSAELVMEPGVVLRVGHTDQAHNLLASSDLVAWERRLDAGVTQLDMGVYADADLRIVKRLRISGGGRADLLGLAVDDRLAHATRNAADVFLGPRITAEVEATRGLTASIAYGEGFRSRDAASMQPGDGAYTRVRSVEVGMRATDRRKRFTTSLALFDTFVDEELVFEATSGSLEPAGSSTRRGLVGSATAKPWSWLVLATSLSVTNAVFTGPGAGAGAGAGDGHFVPNVAPILFRADASARHAIARVGGKAVVGRIGVGYTYMAPRHLTDDAVGRPEHVLNAGVGVRWEWLDVAVDGYNLLGLRYADDAEVYASNWSAQPPTGGVPLPPPAPATLATHVSAAAPTTLLGTVALHF